MAIKLSSTLLAFIFLFSINCYCQNKADTAIAIHYQTKDFDVAIFPSSFDYKYGMNFIKAKERFTPTMQDIDKAENSLKYNLKDYKMYPPEDSILSKKLNNYRRQYIGYTDSIGRRVLYISCFSKKAIDTLNWLNKVIFIWDLGTDYWRIYFDLNTGKFFGFQDAGIE